MTNRKIVHHVTRQYMKKNKKRTFTTLFGIVCMVMLMTCVFVGKETAMHYLETLASQDKGKWHVSAYDVTAKQYEEIKQVEHVKGTVISANYEHSEFAASSTAERPFLQVKAYDTAAFDWMNIQKRYMVDMLSDISHQIKTPLTAITMMTELLKAPELSDEKRLDYVAKIDQQTKRITWFVRNLLTLSQLEADMLELKKEKESLKSILDSIMETFEIMAEVKDIQLTCDVPEEIVIACDRQWTTEAISNIVKNCIEHTPEGGRVSVQAIQHNIATEIAITDTGKGIAKEHLPYIFKRFYKAPGSSNSSVGIGLSMSKQIIMRQNGNITVESEVGKGSKFLIKMY